MSAVSAAVAPTRWWCAWCAGALVAFQLVIAVLAWANRASQEAAFLVSGFAPTPAAAEGSVVGAVVVHVVLAGVCLRLAVTVPRGGLPTRVLGSAPLLAVAIGGVAALALPGQTWLSPVGVALAAVALVLLWWPVRRSDDRARRA